MMQNADENVLSKIKVRNLVLWFFLLGIPTFIAILIIADTFTPMNPNDPFVYLIFSFLTYGIVMFWLKRSFRSNKSYLKKLFGSLPKTKKLFLNILIILPALVFSLGAVLVSYYILSFPFPGFVEKLLNEKFFLGSSDTLIPVSYNIAAFILTVAIAPFVEEVFFRGFLISRWTLKWDVNRALIISSLIFALFHADLIGSFVFGLVMGIAYIKMKTLWVPIIMHMLNNATIYVIALLSIKFGSSSVTDYYGISQLRSDALIGAGLLLISTPLVGYYLYKNWPKEGSIPPALSTEKP